MHYLEEPPFQHGDAPKVGVLLANLGTPDEPTPKALRRYLREFLSDRRVIELPRWQWYPILYGPVLTFRPRKVAKLYASIWTDDGSPLLAIGRRLVSGLEEHYRNSNPDAELNLHFALGMRYGNPSIRSALDELRNHGCTHLVFLPLYPHYAAPTTASTIDALAAELPKWRRIPELRTINTYHDDPGYISALATTIRETWQDGGPPEKLLFSYHGVPKRYFEGGDPYHCLCHKTTRLVVEELGFDNGRVLTAFQSQFGREEWVKPATDESIESLAKLGVKSLDVLCPGFSADCLETLEEIDVENRNIFLDNGGERFRYIPCLNDRPEHVELLAGLLDQHLQGWCALTSSSEQAAELQESARRAEWLEESPADYGAGVAAGRGAAGRAG